MRRSTVACALGALATAASGVLIGLGAGAAGASAPPPRHAPVAGIYYQTISFDHTPPETYPLLVSQNRRFCIVGGPWGTWTQSGDKIVLTASPYAGQVYVFNAWKSPTGLNSASAPGNAYENGNWLGLWYGTRVGPPPTLRPGPCDIPASSSTFGH